MIPDQEFVKGANRNQFLQALISGLSDAEVIYCGRGSNSDLAATLSASARLMEQFLFGVQRIAIAKERMPGWITAVIDSAMLEFELRAKPPEKAADEVKAGKEGAPNDCAA